MIVKDESHIIEQTLQNVYEKFGDRLIYYCIDDTGSSDATKEIIKNYFDKVGISGQLFDTPWRNFGYNRSKALKHCYGKPGKYIYVIDADDSICGDFVLPNKLTHDSYMLNIGQGFTYQRVQIFKNDGSWCYRGVLHEFPTNNKKYTKARIEGNYYIKSGRTGNRSKDPKKYLNDALTFEKALKDMESNPNHPERDLKGRYVFYMAQSYKDYNDNVNALKNYKRRVEMGGWYEEIWYSLYQIGNLLVKMKKPENEIEKAYVSAYKK